MTCDVANLEQRFSRLFLGTKFKTTPRPLESVSHPHCRNQALLEVAHAGHSVITQSKYIITVVACIDKFGSSI